MAGLELDQHLHLHQHSMNQGIVEECTLKYLGFFPAAFSSVCLYVSAIYEAAKDQAGPLRPGVEDVEVVLKAVMRPVLRIAGDQSIKLLDYVDKKVDEKLKVVDDLIPGFVRPIASYAQVKIKKTESTKLLNERRLSVDGPASSHGVAYEKEAFSDYWTYNTIEKFTRILHLRGVVSMLGPHAIYSAHLFNHFGCSLREAHVPLSGLIPNVPVHILERAFYTGCADVTEQKWETYKGAC